MAEGSACRIAATILAFISHFLLGLSVQLIGPSLIDISEQNSEPVKETNMVYIGQSVGMALGSSFIPFVKRFNIRYRLIVAHLLTGIGTGIAGLSSNFILTLSMLCVQGLGCGMTDVCAFVYFLSMWDNKHPWLIQMVLSMITIGQMVAPLVDSPFLSELSHVELSALSSKRLEKMNSSSPFLTNHKSSHSFMWIPFTIVAILHFFHASLLFGLTAFLKRKRSTYKHLSNSEEEDSEETTIFQRISAKEPLPKGLLVPLCVQSLLVYGLQNMYGSVIPVFAIKGPFHLSKSVSNGFSSMFWAAFFTGRLLCAAIGKCVKTKYLAVAFPTLGCLVCVVLACQLFFREAYELGSVLLGLIMGPIFPLIIAWHGQHYALQELDISVTYALCSLGYMCLATLTSYLVLSGHLAAFCGIFMTGFILVLVTSGFGCLYLEKRSER